MTIEEMDLDNHAIQKSKSTMLGTTIDTQRVIRKKCSPNLNPNDVRKPSKKNSSKKKKTVIPPNVSQSSILSPISSKKSKAKAAFTLYKKSVQMNKKKSQNSSLS